MARTTGPGSSRSTTSRCGDPAAHPWNEALQTKPAYNAIIYQKGPNAGARGYFLTKQPAIIDYSGESGSVSLQGRDIGL